MIQVAETNRRLAELHHRLARIQQEDIVLKCFRFNKKNLESRFGGLGSLELGLIVEKTRGVMSRVKDYAQSNVLQLTPHTADAR